MKWEDLTAQAFENALRASDGVCVLPIGCLEKHGDHLPLGTDMMIARAVSEKAAESEPFVVFPYYFLAQVSEVKHHPGTIAIDGELQMRLLGEMVKEIRRNGFRKIVLANGHGGNNYWLRYFVQTMLDARRDYIVYVYDLWELSPEQHRDLEARFETPGEYGHADHMETSAILHLDPSLVNMDRLNPGEWDPLGRGRWMNEERLYSSIHWYAEYPHQIAGDPSLSTAAYGQAYLAYCSANLAKAVKRIKADESALALQREFYDRCDDVSRAP
ncbi:creatininase family protein [Cohnella sp. REN36]|uniref:creatininase family protein n=1 Tax=Cohnella sp. REN36 TaxID=2887347 RepID=UPI001D139449|nr:creatininase family protein [Cohnella sp. REN36]MCC3376566.1 creatininase family protein [Cohnella sp. REN36]